MHRCRRISGRSEGVRQRRLPRMARQRLRPSNHKQSALRHVVLPLTCCVYTATHSDIRHIAARAQAPGAARPLCSSRSRSFPSSWMLYAQA